MALLEELLGNLPTGDILGESSLLSVTAATFEVVQLHSLVCGIQHQRWLEQALVLSLMVVITQKLCASCGTYDERELWQAATTVT